MHWTIDSQLWAPSRAKMPRITKKCKILTIIAVIILIIIAIAIAVLLSLQGCKVGYTGDQCDVCDNGYHMDNNGLCKGLKIKFPLLR